MFRNQSESQIRNALSPFQHLCSPFGGLLVGEMANLRTAIDAAFYDLNVSTSRTLDGMVRSIPGDPIPMDGSRASRVLRIQQLSLLGNGFPLGLVPSFSPPSKKELGPLALQTVFFKAAISKWYRCSLRPLEMKCYFLRKYLDSSILRDFKLH